ncbi:LysR family transcriptional regulator [Pseudomonas sp. GOM7]|uniref:LysR family transcriptional regulator n=1 Tax=Pseudomonas sp. GOM7 TaxID=2998079 RepID=UPI00227C233C|nr:LysR family transcriptional regulator [Pseudomonas sp. GOM7]WAJ39165.1 LysR family transcriptional regulator [Pseudomonas sp. GOM7]
MKLPSGIDMDLLLTLDALLDEQNITHAALRLGISQPAMSARLARLRRVFGERLFIAAPTGRGVLPTPRALALRPTLRQVLSGMSALLEPVVFDPATSQRAFVVALHENPALMLGAELFNRIREQAPMARLRFVLPDPNTLFLQMEEGEIDLFIGIGEAINQGWVGRQLFSDHFVTAQRKGHPRGQRELDLAAFCSLPHLLVSSAGDPFSGIVDRALTKLGSSRQVVMSTQSYAMAPPLVAGTDLLCTLPRRLLQQFATSLDLFEPPIVLPSLSLNAYWHPRNHEDAASIWLREQILSVAGVIGPK